MKSVVVLLLGIMIITSCGGKSVFWPANVPIVGYIQSRPLDQTSIPVFDVIGNPIGTASCTNGDWREANAFFRELQRADYITPKRVLLKRELSTSNYTPTFQIIGR